MAEPAMPTQPSSNPSLRGLLKRSTLARGPSPGPVHKTLAGAANLANLLPTGTVLAFQALTPSFSNGGSCSHVTNKTLTGLLVGFFSLVCFLSSFTDTFVGPTGKLYYGIATPKGLYVFNVGSSNEDQEVEKEEEDDDLYKYRMRFIDFVHAFVSSLVFMVIAMGDPHVVTCLFGDIYNLDAALNNALLVNLPLVVGALSSFLFLLFPTTRRGIGYADMAPNQAN